ncbi:UNVERIFIED_CONTAM: hypothetical protein GTU68_011154 [Idotea baltica]|nr:hypothetical protein [Idotea baltica]
MRQESIVFTNGCFDLLHSGHIHTLSEAADLGDRLIVGLNADVSVQKLKGEKRPILNQDQRARILSALIMVDAIYIFSEETPLSCLEMIKPDFLVKGGDYQKEKVVGYDLLTSYGGEVHIIPFEEDISTTSILVKV